MADINTIKGHLNAVADSVNKIIEGMKDGEKIKLSDLSNQVGAEVGLDGDEILSHVTFIAHHLDGVKTERGRNGGLYKGGKPAVVKPAKKTSAKTATVPASNSDAAPINIDTSSGTPVATIGDVATTVVPSESTEG